MITGFILIIIVIVPLCIYLYLTNKQLLEKISRLEKEKKDILERKAKKQIDQDVLPITRLSTNIKPNNQTKYIIQKNNSKKEPPKVNNEIKPIAKEKNINIDNYYPNNRPFNERNNEKYLQELSNNLNEKITNEPIRLTDYEQKQEDNAIISYEELKNKSQEKTIYLNELDDINTFLNNLKEFRNNLDRK